MSKLDYRVQNKKAWEYNAYEFWVKQSGAPAERAKKMVLVRKWGDGFLKSGL